MKVLTIDMCGSSGSVALGRVEVDGVVVAAQAELAGKTYSARLVPAIQELLAEQGMTAGELNAVVVVTGPGSFTGVRIGVSSAKGLVEALGIRVLAVSRLAVLAHKAGVEFAALDAGRREMYFRGSEREVLLPIEGAATTGPVAVCEDSLRAAFAGAVAVAAPTAADALRYAAEVLRKGDFIDVGLLDGNYVRRPDAEVMAEAGKA